MNTNIYEPFSFEKQTFKCVSFNDTEFIMDWTMEPNGNVPTHIHKYMDEHFIITKGEVKFKVDGKAIFKKEGDELLVPKGVPHSITNATKEGVAVRVKYSPCADTHRFFIIMATLDKVNPGSFLNVLKYSYLVPRLELKEFSSLQPAFVLKIMTVMVSIVGKLSGWDKLVEKFK